MVMSGQCKQIVPLFCPLGLIVPVSFPTTWPVFLACEGLTSFPKVNIYLRWVEDVSSPSFGVLTDMCGRMHHSGIGD